MRNTGSALFANDSTERHRGEKCGLAVKPIPPPRLGNRARLAPPEPAIAVPHERVVRPIAQPLRQDPEQGGKPPSAADLAYETLYRWRVVARDDQGGETASPTWTFTTEDAPNQPPSGPHTPDPTNGATGIQPDIVLTWSGGDDPDGDPVTFDVYFGTSDPPPFADSRPVASFDPPGSLLFGTDYYWRIVARDPNGGEVSGSTWRFTTAP